MIAGWFTPISPACQTKRKPTILALRPPPIIACERYHDVVVRVPILRRGVRYFVRSPANQHGGLERTDSPLHGVLLNARRREAAGGGDFARVLPKTRRGRAGPLFSASPFPLTAP